MRITSGAIRLDRSTFRSASRRAECLNQRRPRHSHQRGDTDNFLTLAHAVEKLAAWRRLTTRNGHMV
jgi:hypothetical protein